MKAHEYGTQTIFKTLSDIQGKKITVMGLGLNGGGLESARFLLKYGAFTTVTDLKTQEDLQSSVQELAEYAKSINAENRLKFVLGTHNLCDFENADAVIKNPIVKFDKNEFLSAAKSIETDLSLFLRFTKAPIIAVTGSKGKSSTVSAIYYGLKEAGFTAFLGGNITVSPLTFLEQTNANTPVVLELSSWQLADLRGRKLLKPKIAVITKIVPDHQNWYENSMEKYIADKKLIFADQDHNDFFVYLNDEWGKTFAEELNKKQNHPTLIQSSIENFTHFPSKFAVPAGMHTKENLLTAAIVLKIMISFNSTVTDEQKIASIISQYPGIHHRLEYFFTWQNVLFYNDSAATVPEAAAAAISSFDQKTHLICGGTDKNLLFEPLAKEIVNTQSIYLLSGTGTDKLRALLENQHIDFFGPYNSLKTLLTNLKSNLEKTEQKEIVVFSPGATSFGMFKNEFDRGNTFKNLVKELFT